MRFGNPKYGKRHLNLLLHPNDGARNYKRMPVYINEWTAKNLMTMHYADTAEVGPRCFYLVMLMYPNFGDCSFYSSANKQALKILNSTTVSLCTKLWFGHDCDLGGALGNERCSLIIFWASKFMPGLCWIIFISSGTMKYLPNKSKKIREIEVFVNNFFDQRLGEQQYSALIYWPHSLSCLKPGR